MPTTTAALAHGDIYLSDDTTCHVVVRAADLPALRDTVETHGTARVCHLTLDEADVIDMRNRSKRALAETTPWLHPWERNLRTLAAAHWLVHHPLDEPVPDLPPDAEDRALNARDARDPGPTDDWLTGHDHDPKDPA